LEALSVNSNSTDIKDALADVKDKVEGDAHSCETGFWDYDGKKGMDLKTYVVKLLK
jgi:hypothetical protein